MRHIACILGLLLFGLSAKAQEQKIVTKKANEALKEGDLAKAETLYEKALQLDPGYKEAQFNLGNLNQIKARQAMEKASKAQGEEEKKALMGEIQKWSKNAVAQFEKVAADAADAPERNKAQYNLGNAELLSGQIDKSINAYKASLRADPTDDDARYNLAYAQHLKQQQQDQNKDQQQDQKDKQDQEQKKDDQKKDEKKDDSQQEQQQPQPDQLSKEEAEKMLEALMRQEKDLQDKLNKKKKKAQPIKIEKDW